MEQLPGCVYARSGNYDGGLDRPDGVHSIGDPPAMGNLIVASVHTGALDGLAALPVRVEVNASNEVNRTSIIDKVTPTRYAHEGR